MAMTCERGAELSRQVGTRLSTVSSTAHRGYNAMLPEGTTALIRSPIRGGGLMTCLSGVVLTALVEAGSRSDLARLRPRPQQPIESDSLGRGSSRN